MTTEITVNNNPSEKHFLAEGGRDPKVDDTNNAINILGVNPYLFMTHAYEGTGGFRDGNYLVPHTREMFFVNRKQLSAYRNYVRPIIRALVEPVFVDEAIRILTDANGNELPEESDTLFGTFIEDCDNKDTCLQSFTEDVCTSARLHGVTFVVMDNFPQSMQPETTEMAIEERIMPYVYQRYAYEVEDVTTDDFGCITSITFIEEPVKDSKGDKQSRFRTWTDQYSQVMTKNPQGQLVAVSAPVVHGLGMLPVIVVYGTKRKNNSVFVEPPLYDLARLNTVIFNKDSEIRDQERAQAFSNFYVQSSESGNFTLGPHNVIILPMETSITPGFASPDSAILAGLVSNTKDLVDALFQMAEQSGVKGVQSASSGVAIQWDFYSTESQLKKTAYTATKLEDDIHDLFVAYTGEDLEYVVQYPCEFQPGDAKTTVTMYKDVLSMSPPIALKNKVWEKVARVILTDEDPKEVAEIIEEMETELEGPEMPEETPMDTGMTGPMGMTGMMGPETEDRMTIEE